ncbi:hypothetical protein [Brachybacterium sp. UNK5269]|uniref:hypothetical protein n=1 Tax=Brachybacterium sp. UNK5269 TaxID=3408576 RepID=UPI003BAEDBEC
MADTTGSAEPSIDGDPNDYFRFVIAEIEADLTSRGTDVLTELERLSTALSEAGADDAPTALADVSEMTTDYSATVAPVSDARNPVILANPTLAASRAAVAAIAAWFISKGYLLSAELIKRARDNKTLNSNYTPSYRSGLINSPVIRKIRSQSKASGSDSFPSSTSGTYAKDNYYAIHAFNWTKSGIRVSISDRYDFAPGKYSGLAGTAVNAMWLAQQLGHIKPYYVKVTV